MIPGDDILDDALTIIDGQAITYYKASGRSLNDIGQYITAYASPIMISGSFQPVPRSVYEQLGLDFQKSYFNFYVSKDLIDLQRDVSADQIEYKGQRYQCESSTDWFPIDGWLSILCVLIAGAAN